MGGLEIFLNILFLVIGIFLLIKGADIFVASASSLAKKMKISALVIGLTVVAFGTSAPELAVSLSASIALIGTNQTADIAMGNVVGSNIMNLLVVLGLSCAITPIIVKKSVCKREFPYLILATLVLVFFAFDTFLFGAETNKIVRGEAIILLAMLFYFVYMSIKGAKADEQALADDRKDSEEEIKEMPMAKSIILLLVGLIGVVLGGVFVTNTASSLATSAALAMGIEESLVTTLVGLTVVAVGTSLPELVTSIIAAKKHENEIALGNVLGSNVFNTLFIVGCAGVVTPLGINSEVLFDMLVMIFATIITFIFARNGKLGRKEGLILLGIYLIYLTYIILRVFIPEIRIAF